MSIFKDITDRYCKKILENYQTLADEKTYQGKEAGLLIQRNEFAHCLLKKIQSIEVNDNDYASYFKQIINEINSTLEEVMTAVAEYNRPLKTTFTADLYETFYTAGLINFINALNELVQKSPPVITELRDVSSFKNDRNVPWIYQFSFVLYEYIVEKEFDIATQKISRDIFDSKKQLILSYIQNAAKLHSLFKNEDDEQYQDLMKKLLERMSTEEQDVQQRKTENSNTTNMFSYFTSTLYKASEVFVKKSQLGQKVDFLIKEFNEKTSKPELVYQ